MRKKLISRYEAAFNEAFTDKTLTKYELVSKVINILGTRKIGSWKQFRKWSYKRIQSIN